MIGKILEKKIKQEKLVIKIFTEKKKTELLCRERHSALKFYGKCELTLLYLN